MFAIAQPGRVARRTFRGGFTLIETAITTMIIGVGTVAMMGLLAAGTNSNQQTATLTTAVDLADNIHELCDQTSYPTVGTYWGLPAGQPISAIFTSGNVSWLNGQNFSPPIDATASSISGMGTWTQDVTVNNVSSTSITTTLGANSATYPMARVTVTILHSGQQVFQTSWLVAR